MSLEGEVRRVLAKDRADHKLASCVNATISPLPANYPYTIEPCTGLSGRGCVGAECPQCAGLGEYYLIKRMKGQWLLDEATSHTHELGEKPNW